VSTFIERNAGSTDFLGSPSSIDTTEPMCGAIFDKPDTGLRPI
jgi:hypothetical protein